MGEECVGSMDGMSLSVYLLTINEALHRPYCHHHVPDHPHARRHLLIPTLFIPALLLPLYLYITMASTTEAHSVAAKSTSDITADDRNKSGYYGVTESGPDGGKNKQHDGQAWQYQQNDEGEMDELRAREAADDAQFEQETKLPGASDPDVPEEDKSILQKGIDKVQGLQTEAGKEYLAS